MHTSLSKIALFAAVSMAAPIPRPAFTQAKSHHTSSAVERMANSYAIYSLLMPGEVLARMESSQKQGWAIAATSINAEDVNPALAPEAALQAPPTHAKWFHEAVADYNLHKDQRLVFERKFHLDRPYILLTTTEVDEFRAARASVHSNSTLERKYRGYPGITFFSQVYFNPDQTAALVYMLDWCGNLCAQAQWIYLEKQDGQWQRRSGRG